MAKLLTPQSPYIWSVKGPHFALNQVMAKPIFSIILPTFNRAYCLATAIQSVLDQSFESWELIIVDDGSTDDTQIIAEGFANSDSRIQYLFQENSGASAARNYGIEKACGLYLAFLDSDDRYTQEHLAVRYQVFQGHPKVSFIHGDAIVEGNPLIADRDDYTKFVDLSAGHIPIGGTFAIVAKEARRIGGFPNVNYSEDGLFFQRALKSGLKTMKIPQKTYFYNRNSTDSICTNILKHSSTLK